MKASIRSAKGERRSPASVGNGDVRRKTAGDSRIRRDAGSHSRHNPFRARRNAPVARRCVRPTSYESPWGMDRCILADSALSRARSGTGGLRILQTGALSCRVITVSLKKKQLPRSAVLLRNPNSRWARPCPLDARAQGVATESGAHNVGQTTWGPPRHTAPPHGQKPSCSARPRRRAASRKGSIFHADSQPGPWSRGVCGSWGVGTLRIGSINGLLDGRQSHLICTSFVISEIFRHSFSLRPIDRPVAACQPSRRGHLHAATCYAWRELP